MGGKEENEGKWRKMGGAWGNRGHGTQNVGCKGLWRDVVEENRSNMGEKWEKMGRNTHFSQSRFPILPEVEDLPHSPLCENQRSAPTDGKNGHFCHSPTLTAAAASADAWEGNRRGGAAIPGAPRRRPKAGTGKPKGAAGRAEAECRCACGGVWGCGCRCGGVGGGCGGVGVWVCVCLGVWVWVCVCVGGCVWGGVWGCVGVWVCVCGSVGVWGGVGVGVWVWGCGCGCGCVCVVVWVCGGVCVWVCVGGGGGVVVWLCGCVGVCGCGGGGVWGCGAYHQHADDELQAHDAAEEDEAHEEEGGRRVVLRLGGQVGALRVHRGPHHRDPLVRGAEDVDGAEAVEDVVEVPERLDPEVLLREALLFAVGHAGARPRGDAAVPGERARGGGGGGWGWGWRPHAGAGPRVWASFPAPPRG